MARLFRRNFRRRYNNRTFNRGGKKFKNVSVSRLKNDIIRINLPKKIKIIGLPRKEVTYLERHFSFTLPGVDTNQGHDRSEAWKQFYLIPAYSENFENYIDWNKCLGNVQAGHGIDAQNAANNHYADLARYNTLSVLAIYISIQPTVIS